MRVLEVGLRPGRGFVSSGKWDRGVQCNQMIFVRDRLLIFGGVSVLGYREFME